MSLAFSDIVGAPGSLPSSLTFAPGISIGAVPNLPDLNAGQKLAIRSWMATASNPGGGGAKLSQAQIARLVLVWAYNLGVSAPAIYAYCAANT
jgi:hypothetical protein